jgi:alginate O-acetyltransferase complex protein AlgI
MLFSSIVFIFFFLPFVLFLYYIPLRKSRKWQNIMLLLVSLGFYAWGEPWFVLVMILSIIGNWYFGILVDRFREDKNRGKVVIFVCIVFNISILWVFKYLNFTVDNINAIFGANFSISEIILPIGISFFTFQAISYVIDIYRRDGEVQKTPLNVGLYISFFPQLIAGPIVRYQTIADQIENRRESFDDFSNGVCRFIIGLGKKVLIANNMALIADTAFGMAKNTGDTELSILMAWLGALAYTFQIYFDFSGYSDMAIGLGRMFGFKFLENFNYPYISSSITEFWRRWHISLGSWFRDYVYIPLGGSKVNNKGRLVFNLFVVWLLTGVWHGANWTFIMWGILYFVLLVFEKLTGLLRKRSVVGHIYTLFFVVIGWVLFRAENLGDALNYLKIMFGGGVLFDPIALQYIAEYKYFYIFAVVFSLPIAQVIKIEKFDLGRLTGPLYVIACMLILALSVSSIVKGSYNPFIYFNF